MQLANLTIFFCRKMHQMEFYIFFAVILFQLHILFWLTDFLLPICCRFIINGADKFDNIYFENTASFLERKKIHTVLIHADFFSLRMFCQ